MYKCLIFTTKQIFNFPVAEELADLSSWPPSLVASSLLSPAFALLCHRISSESWMSSCPFLLVLPPDTASWPHLRNKINDYSRLICDNIGLSVTPHLHNLTEKLLGGHRSMAINQRNESSCGTTTRLCYDAVSTKFLINYASVTSR